MIVKPTGDKNTYEIIYQSTSGGSLIRWIKKNPHVSNFKKTYDNPMIDELLCEFDYRGYKFSFETPFVDYWINRESKDCPDDVFHELIEYLKTKKVSKLAQWFVDREYKRREKRKRSEC